MATNWAGDRATWRAGNAGLLATFVFAVAGMLYGAAAAYVGELNATREHFADDTPRLHAAPTRDIERRISEVRNVIDRFPLERFATPELEVENVAANPRKDRPKIIIILDDIGLDIYAADAAFSLPGPVTYSILPYADDAQILAAMAEAGEGDVMLHLPMEPNGDEDPGPNALRGDMTGGALFQSLEWNLSRFNNFVGVNNHMGSKLTTDSATMKFILDYLENRGVYFIDSVTTSDSVAHFVGAKMGAQVLRRDVFLDPTPGDKDLVRLQLRLTEQIALETGYAIAIGHPRPETLEVLGPWLASAEARGFELTTPSKLLARNKPAMLASAPDLRG